MDKGRRLQIRDLTRGLAGGAAFLEYVAVTLAVLGAIGGIVIATQTKTTSLGTDTFGAQTAATHPYVAFGVVVAVASIVEGVFGWAIARGLRVFANYVGLQAEEPMAMAEKMTPPPVEQNTSSGADLAIVKANREQRSRRLAREQYAREQALASRGAAIARARACSSDDDQTR